MKTVKILGTGCANCRNTLALVEAVTSSFDARKLRAGNIYTIDRLFDGRACHWRCLAADHAGH